jgi:hypothetical protein
MVAAPASVVWLGIGWLLVVRSRPARPPPPPPSALSPFASNVVTGAPRLQLRAINWSAVFKSSFMLLFLAYPGVSLKVLRVFKCVDVEGTSYLVADMRLKVSWGGRVCVAPLTPYASLRCVGPHTMSPAPNLVGSAVLHQRVGRLRGLLLVHVCCVRGGPTCRSVASL